MTDSASAVNAASAGMVGEGGSFRDRNNMVFSAPGTIHGGAPDTTNRGAPDTNRGAPGTIHGGAADTIHGGAPDTNRGAAGTTNRGAPDTNRGAPDTIHGGAPGTIHRGAPDTIHRGAPDIIYRGVSELALANWRALAREPFFEELAAEGKVVPTGLLDERAAPPGLPDNWAGYMVHERIPFVSYPYEWSFGMLKDAALLQLELLERAIPQGWTLKDASAYNVQWRGAQPVFIDIPSFEPYVEGKPWVGYRQFCMMYLYPLMLAAYRGIDFIPLLRSNLEGIEPRLADRILTGFSRFRKGVFSHVYLHARMDSRYSHAELDEAKSLTEDARGEVSQGRGLKHSRTMVLGMIDGLRRTVSGLSIADSRTVWGNYDTDHSYSDASFAAKKAFVEKHAGARRRKLAWDIGCNTGTFSKLAAAASDYVVAIDGDAKAIERLYRDQKAAGATNILPLVMNLANISPGQGWRGRERKALDARGRPELVLCLALIHHIVISANIPLAEFVGWLRELEADVVLEHVGLEDDMKRMLLRNRVNQYDELSEENFLATVSSKFDIADSQPVKGGHRKLHFLTPKA